MRFLIGLGLALCAVVPASARQTDLTGVEVVADTRVILRVDVSGAMGPRTVVVSDVVGITCGPDAYRYTPHENRQCWVWVKRSKPVVLTVRGMQGSFGKDWSVAWKGCEVIDGGTACRIDPREETNVAAVLTGTPQ